MGNTFAHVCPYHCLDAETKNKTKNFFFYMWDMMILRAA
jgi:hypothetical protein